MKMGKALLVFVAAAVCAQAADPGLLRLAAPDARVVAGIRFADIRATPFGQAIVNQIAGTETRDLHDFVAATGFDPRRDIEELIVSAPAEPGGRWLVAARGAFPTTRLMELARSAGAEIASYGGVSIAGSMPGAAASPNGRPMAFAFLDSTTAIAGDDQSIREAVDRSRSARGLPLALADRIARASQGNQAWFAARELTTVADPSAGAIPFSAGMFRTLEEASGGARFGQNADVAIEATTKTAEDATALAGVMRFLAGIGQSGRGSQSQALQRLLGTLKLATEGNVVRIAFSVAPPDLEDLALGWGPAFGL